MRLTLQIIEEVCEGPGSLGETSGRIRLVAPPLAAPLERLAQQYARGTAGIGTDQLWAMLGQYGAATLPDGELY